MDDRLSNAGDLTRSVATSAFSAAVFGAAAGLGSGLSQMARGAWCAPALFVGGAALALPPLYVAHSLGGADFSPEELVQAARSALARVSLVLLGLAGPAAYLALTLRTHLGPVLLIVTALVMGTAGVSLLGSWTAPTEASATTRTARAVWYLFAFALGARLMFGLVQRTNLLGGA